MDRCRGQQRDHLCDWHAHCAIWICARKPFLHGPLREQSLELARKTALKDGTRTILVAAAMVVAILANGRQAAAQSSAADETKRQAKRLLIPKYPDLAKKLNLSGAVRIEVTIGPDGTVKHTRVLGGHPLLAASAEEAAQKSAFEPGPKETTEIIEFKF